MREQFFNYQEFDGKAVSDALDTSVRPQRDVAHGDGQALDVGDAVLEVYPGAGVARVTTPDARVEMYRVPRYAVTTERLVFEQGEDADRSRMLLRKDGKVSFFPVLRATDGLLALGTTQSEPKDSPSASDASETTTAAYDSRSATPEGQETPQVQLRGRLGRDAWYSDQGDQPIGGFPLAVNDEQGRTTWHRVVVFGDAAAHVHEAHAQGRIRKGRMVDVTGQTVVREEPKQSGGVRKVAEFHATAVTHVQATKSRPTPQPRGASGATA